jgi:hypothetical protein
MNTIMPERHGQHNLRDSLRSWNVSILHRTVPSASQLYMRMSVTELIFGVA